ncbi:hypothetical protein CPAV1605_742 [seawater metagenome]|uniref:EamA domain-containing protein n=1 Tax=seawater metagenome TaxID=1561972 RepID=A0A5E8CIU4_9ZZZZ
MEINLTFIYTLLITLSFILITFINKIIILNLGVINVLLFQKIVILLLLIPYILLRKINFYKISIDNFWDALYTSIFLCSIFILYKTNNVSSILIINTIGIILLVTLYGIIIKKEKLNNVQKIGFFLMLIGLIFYLKN